MPRHLTLKSDDEALRRASGLAAAGGGGAGWLQRWWNGDEAPADPAAKPPSADVEPQPADAAAEAADDGPALNSQAISVMKMLKGLGALSEEDVANAMEVMKKNRKSHGPPPPRISLCKACSAVMLVVANLEGALPAAFFHASPPPAPPPPDPAEEKQPPDEL